MEDELRALALKGNVIHELRLCWERFAAPGLVFVIPIVKGCAGQLAKRDVQK